MKKKYWGVFVGGKLLDARGTLDPEVYGVKSNAEFYARRVVYCPSSKVVVAPVRIERVGK